MSTDSNIKKTKTREAEIKEERRKESKRNSKDGILRP